MKCKEELEAEKLRVVMLEAGWKATIGLLREAESLRDRLAEALRNARRYLDGDPSYAGLKSVCYQSESVLAEYDSAKNQEKQ